MGRRRQNVGDLRPCSDCGEMFPRRKHRCSYCKRCHSKRSRASEARSAAKKQPHVHISYRGKLPGGTRVCRPGQKEIVLRPTYKTSLPFCPICHRYNGMCEHRQVVYG